jgi:hypothetical protein
MTTPTPFTSSYKETKSKSMNKLIRPISDIRTKNVTRSKNVEVVQYVYIKSELERTLGPQEWLVSQRSSIGGARSLNEQDLHENLVYFRVPQTDIESITSCTPCPGVGFLYMLVQKIQTTESSCHLNVGLPSEDPDELVVDTVWKSVLRHLWFPILCRQLRIKI